MLRLEYRSHDSNVGKDLYSRCLPLSNRFDRAVGFFASSVFSACPEAFKDFFGRRGRIRLVCNEILDEEDINAIVLGIRDRSKIIRESAITLLDHEPAAVRRDRLKLLTWLVATGAIEFRIAFRRSNGKNDIYHEKLGIFRDREGDSVVFTGSANESFAGLSGNFESVDVFRSWISEERRRVDQKQLAFERLWDNKTAGLEVMQFHEAASRGLLKARPKIEPKTEDQEDISPQPVASVPAIFGIEEILLIPSSISLREHQKNAIKGWFDANGRGIFQMATGSGKTIAALAAAVKLFEWASKPILVVIVCPYLHLCAQWIEEAKREETRKKRIDQTVEWVAEGKQRNWKYMQQ